MKQFTTTSLFLILLFVSSASNAQNNKGNMGSTSGRTGAMPYKADYSSTFQIGDPKFSAIVLKAWKDYDNNQLETLGDFISDTLTAIFPDGSVVKGKDNFINRIKSYRSGLTDAKDNVTAWLSLKTPDHPNDNIVCIWGDEHDTKADGSKEVTSLHEVWVFNKDNKLSYFQQYAGQMPKSNQ